MTSGIEVTPRTWPSSCWACSTVERVSTTRATSPPRISVALTSSTGWRSTYTSAAISVNAPMGPPSGLCRVRPVQEALAVHHHALHPSPCNQRRAVVGRYVERQPATVYLDEPSLGPNRPADRRGGQMVELDPGADT